MQLVEAHDKAVRTIENLAPFYPQDIFEKLASCLQLVRLEINTIVAGEVFSEEEERSRLGEQRLEKFTAAYGEASEAVRRRIATLSILPAT